MRIALHRDFLDQNVGINVIADLDTLYLSGLRGPSAVRYAIYDFGASQIISPDINVETVKHSPVYAGEDPSLSLHPPVNPFQGDMVRIGNIMQRHVRHIENHVPEIGPFFVSLTTEDATKRLTARRALRRFQDIRSKLTSAQLAGEVTGRYWFDGKI